MKFTAHYSIKDLEKLSGIKAHTLRIWEKRYGLFQPERTDTNIRYYSNKELKLILNISHLNKSGIKISKIAAMSEEEIARKVAEAGIRRTGQEDMIDDLIVAMIDLSESRFTQSFGQSLLRSGFEFTMEQVIFPFFERIGIMWQSGGINPAQEHFMTHMVRQKLLVALDALPITEAGVEETIVLFLPENELHEIALLYYNYILRSRGFHTVYLGQSVPVQNLVRVAEIVQPRYLLSILTTPKTDQELDAFIHELIEIHGQKPILLSGRVLAGHTAQLPAQFKLFRDTTSLLDYF